jgi:hypothetical protein
MSGKRASHKPLIRGQLHGGEWDEEVVACFGNAVVGKQQVIETPRRLRNVNP